MATPTSMGKRLPPHEFSMDPTPAAKADSRTGDSGPQGDGTGKADMPSDDVDVTEELSSKFPMSRREDALSSPGGATMPMSDSQGASAPANKSTVEVVAAASARLVPTAYKEIGHDAVRAVQEALADRQLRAIKPPLFAPTEMAGHAVDGGEGFTRRLVKGAGNGAHVRLGEGQHCLDKVSVCLRLCLCLCVSVSVSLSPSPSPSPSLSLSLSACVTTCDWTKGGITLTR